MCLAPFRSWGTLEVRHGWSPASLALALARPAGERVRGPALVRPAHPPPAPPPAPRGVHELAGGCDGLQLRRKDRPTRSRALTASGERLRPGLRALAVSADLEQAGLTFGTRVEIDGYGEWVVLDRMAPRWRRTIDLYLGDDAAAAQTFGRRSVKIRWWGGRSAQRQLHLVDGAGAARLDHAEHHAVAGEGVAEVARRRRSRARRSRHARARTACRRWPSPS